MTSRGEALRAELYQRVKDDRRKDRRSRTALVIAYYTRIHAMAGRQLEQPHTHHKTDTLGRCSNRSCSLCAILRQIERAGVKQQRRQSRILERADETIEYRAFTRGGLQ